MSRSWFGSERLQLHVTERGSGPPLLLLHGFTGSSEAWPAACVSGLAETHRVVSLDLPGHGLTGGGSDPASYSLDRVLDRVLTALTRLEIETAIWAGYSMGGRVALAAAILWPARVSALILESASPGLASEADRSVRRAHDEVLAQDIEEAGVERFIDRWMALPLFATQRSLGRSRLEAERTRRLHNDGPSLAACLRGLGTGSQPSFWNRLSDVTMPTLVLTGARDKKFTEIGERMILCLPQSAHVVVSGAGHAVHLENPHEWLTHIRDFLVASTTP